MNIQYIELGEYFGYYEIYDFLNAKEELLIWAEIRHLESILDARTEQTTTDDAQLSAPNRHGNMLSYRRNGLWLDAIYRDRIYSNYLRHYKKHFEKFFDHIPEKVLWRYFKYTKDDSTLFAKFGDNGKYDTHLDQSAYTSILWFCEDISAVQGGNLILTDFDHEIKFGHNKMVIFFSSSLHRVSPVTYTKPNVNRYAFSTFYL